MRALLPGRIFAPGFDSMDQAKQGLSGNDRWPILPHCVPEPAFLVKGLKKHDCVI